MKKLSLLIALCMLLTIGGVYATWTYTQNTDVADEAVHKAINLTGVEYSGSYGTYSVNTDNLKMTIDPKANTTHTTALYIEGYVVITFTPNSVAPADIKEHGVESTYALTLSNSDWKYENDYILTLKHTEAHDITWVDNGDGTFSYTISADDLAGHMTLTEFELDTKVKYDAYNTELAKGQIVITVSDGITSSTPTPAT